MMVQDVFTEESIVFFTEILEGFNSLCEIEPDWLAVFSLSDQQLAVLQKREDAPHFCLGHVLQLRDAAGFFDLHYHVDKLTMRGSAGRLDCDKDTTENLRNERKFYSK